MTIQEKQAESEKYEKAYDDGYKRGYSQARFDYEQEPKTGRWIRVDKDKCKCDKCEVISFIAIYPNGDANYCPNCGAKMTESN